MSAISRPVTYVTKVDFAQLDGYGIPADGLGNLGDRYYDIGARRWYLKRWVGNFSGFDYLTVAKSIIGASGDFQLSATMKLSSSVGSSNPTIFGSGASPTNTLVLIRPNSKVALRLARLGTADVGNLAVYPGATWFNLVMYRTGATIGFKINSLDTPTVDPANYVAGTMTTLGQTIDNIDPFIACNFKGVGQGNAFNIPIDDGSGVTARDTSGNGNDGTVTDGSPATFWLQSWVPMDLL